MSLDDEWAELLAEPTLTIPNIAGEDLHGSGQAYAASGWYIGPLAKASKNPGSVLGADWHLKTSRDPKQIAAWFAGGMAGGAGLFLHVGRSGGWVADVDHPDRLDETLAAVIGQWMPPFQQTRPAEPERGHYVFMAPRDRKLGNGLGRLARGWGEARGLNGVIVAAPTPHPDGGQYRWLRTGFVPPMADLLADLLDDASPASDAATDSEVRRFLTTFAAAARPALLDVVVSDFAAQLARGESRHQAAVSTTCWAMRDAFAGFYSAIDAAEALRQRYVDARVVNRLGGRPACSIAQARDEYAGILAWAIGQASLDDPTQRQRAAGDLDLLAGTAAAQPEPAPAPRRPPAQTMSLGALLDSEDPEYDWLVPGLIERGDRIIISGAEGFGKSTLLRQLGLAAAAGRNPFATQLDAIAHEPVRVLLVDCENSSRQLRREFPKGMRALPDVTEVVERFYVGVRTEGIVLDQPKDRLGDRAWLEHQLAEIQPDMLLVGPLYKLMEGDPNGEIESRLLALYLDRIRGGDAQMAIVIEAHAPHNERRPYGWSGWKRWPEFGMHLGVEGALRPFRGGRDDSRQWPAYLRRGAEHEWAWLPGEQVVEGTTDKEQEYDDRVRMLVLRVLGDAAPLPLRMSEIVERVGRRAASVRKAVRFYQDHGWLIVGTDGSDETFRLDPDGPAGSTQ